MALVMLIVLIRTVAVLKGEKQANEFPAGQEHGGSDFYKRLIRAHLNCVENLPVYTAVILTAFALGVPGLTDPLAWWYFGARAGQTTVHLVSTAVPFVMARVTFLLAQYAILGAMIVRIVA